MTPTSAIAQLRTTDLDATIRFYTEVVGLRPAFRWGDFYAGLWAGEQLIHLKRVDEPDPSIPYVAAGEHLHLYMDTEDARGLAEAIAARGVALARPVQETAWGRREFAIRDDQGHTLHFGERL